MTDRPQKRRGLAFVLMLLVAIASTLALGLYGERPEDPDYSDASDFLASAYHIANYGTFVLALTEEPYNPGMGREPGYSLFLAGLMKLDSTFREFSPVCMADKLDCRHFYDVPQWANAALVSASAVLVFLTVSLMYGNLLAVWVAGAHIWLNHEFQNDLFYLISDYLAVFLTALTSFAAAWAWRRNWTLAWTAPAAALAALTLTKSIFLYLAVPLFVLVLAFALTRRVHRRYLLTILVVSGIVYAVPVGGWMTRNLFVGGEFGVTHSRDGVALSTRAIFNRMTPQQFAAALVYWTRGFGDSLAKSVFPEDTWQRFELYNPDGFYLRGQHGYGERVRELIAKEPQLTVKSAQNEIDRQLVTSIITNLPVHAATTLPLFYRGIWIDEFIIFSFPALVWLTIRALRRRNWILLLVLSPGLFSLTFYPIFSLNIPRYQMTALPALALALGFAVAHLGAYLRRWRAARILSVR